MSVPNFACEKSCKNKKNNLKLLKLFLSYLNIS